MGVQDAGAARHEGLLHAGKQIAWRTYTRYLTRQCGSQLIGSEAHEPLRRVTKLQHFVGGSCRPKHARHPSRYVLDDCAVGIQTIRSGGLHVGKLPPHPIHQRTIDDGIRCGLKTFRDAAIAHWSSLTKSDGSSYSMRPARSSMSSIRPMF